MNTYIVAIFSQHAGELTMQRIEAETSTEAVNKALEVSNMTLNEIYNMCQVGDTWVNWQQV